MLIYLRNMEATNDHEIVYYSHSPLLVVFTITIVVVVMLIIVELDVPLLCKSIFGSSTKIVMQSVDFK